MLVKILMVCALIAPMGKAGHAATVYSTGFEAPEYVVGELDGQAGWSTPFGPTINVQVRDDIPNVGAQSLGSVSDQAVAGTGAFRNLGASLSNSILTISSMVTFTNGTRSDWEFNAAFGAGGFLGALRVNSASNWVLATDTGTIDTGVALVGFQTVALVLDFVSGTASAIHDGIEVASGLAFDKANSQLTQVAALQLLTPRFDATALDSFVVDVTRVTPPAPIPLPGTLGLLGVGLIGLGVAKRQKRRQPPTV